MLETINPNHIELFFDPHKMGVKRKDEDFEKFAKGKIFSLQGIECDDFSMPKKEYEVIKHIDKVDGVNFGGVVVKQISGDNSTIFSLTKQDCKNLGIEFQPSLQIFPSNMDWREVKVNGKNKLREFDKNDFSTYPVIKESGLISEFVIAISPIVPHSSFYTHYRVGNVRNVHYKKLDSVVLTPKSGYSHLFPPTLKGYNITNWISGNNDCFVNSQYTSFFIIRLSFNGVNLDPSDIEGLSFNDIFDVKIQSETSQPIMNRYKLVNDSSILKLEKELVNVFEENSYGLPF